MIYLISLILLLNLIGSTNAFLANSINKNYITKRLARVKQDEEPGKAVEKLTPDGQVEVPFNGLVGNSEGRLFNSAVDTYDPMQNTEDLPGEDGSDEKIQAIQDRIQQRVDELKRSGEWGEEGDEYGVDPLRTQNILVTMTDQVKACRPFESFGELTLTYLLVLGTTILLGSYLILLREGSEGFMSWFTRNDFDDATSALNSLRR